MGYEFRVLSKKEGHGEFDAYEYKIKSTPIEQEKRL